MPFSLKVWEKGASIGNEDIDAVLDLASIIGTPGKVAYICGQGWGVCHVGEFRTRAEANAAKEILDVVAPEWSARVVSIPWNRMDSFKKAISGLSYRWLKRASPSEQEEYYKGFMVVHGSPTDEPGSFCASMFWGSLLAQANQTGTKEAFYEAYREAPPMIREAISRTDPEIGGRMLNMTSGIPESPDEEDENGQGDY